MDDFLFDDDDDLIISEIDVYQTVDNSLEIYSFDDNLYQDYPFNEEHEIESNDIWRYQGENVIPCSKLDSYSQELFESPEPDVTLIDQAYSGCNFDPANWDELSYSKKIGELNQLESNLADLQGRSSVEIKSENMDSFWDKWTGRKHYGYYDPNNNEIFINSSLLKSPEMLPNVIDSVVHEGIHAYQHQCVNGEITHYNQLQVEEWAENFRNYKSADLYGMEAYWDQPVEVFARENAAKYLKNKHFA